jgi:O-acetyl-ADP-ribose deacetylase (regulator of RNase III)
MINYLTGDATLPIKTPAIIAHICNSVGGWGSGFVIAVTKRFGKGPENDYRNWYKNGPYFALGKIQLVPVQGKILVANMIAQKGVGGIKPLDLTALETCLGTLYEITKDSVFTVHMPRIGCGLAGGTWEEVEPIILRTMTVDTYVYDFPKANL